MKKMIMAIGSSAVGKSSMLKYVMTELEKRGFRCAICKMDCIHTSDGDYFKALGFPSAVGISQDICPDHFLVSNLPEIWQWAERKDVDYLFIESAGLCHRCSPATEKTADICVIDATASSRSPAQLGPMLTLSDAIAITKVDMISQAEREILEYEIQKLNPHAEIFFFDGREGYGAELVASWIETLEPASSYENDNLRHSMPSGVCSYCVGERRVGSAFQLGVVSKIDFGEDEDE